ncbi:hypothetical protein E1H13_17595 [Nodosilinea sp. P-1105]|nr:hypothetical protein [Nodosilinea sp. P-1105]
MCVSTLDTAAPYLFLRVIDQGRGTPIGNERHFSGWGVAVGSGEWGGWGRWGGGDAEWGGFGFWILD